MIGGTVGKLAVTAFDAIIHALFAPIAKFINTQLIGWLVAVPEPPPGSHVAATEHTVVAMAGAALGAVATISIARFWAPGSPAVAARRSRGLARTVGAALLLPVWPWVFHTAVALANDASTGLLGSGSVTKASANLLAVGVGAGRRIGVPRRRAVRVSIVMAVVASILFLGLLMMKVVRRDLDGPGVHRDADRDRALAGDLVDPARARARVRGVPGGAARVGDVLRGERGDAERRPVPEGVLGVLQRAAGAAGGDRAAVDDAAAADAGWRRWRCSAPARSAAGSCPARSATPPGRRCATPPGSTCRAGRAGTRRRSDSAHRRPTRGSAPGCAPRACWPRARPRRRRRGRRHGGGRRGAGAASRRASRRSGRHDRAGRERQAGWLGRLRGGATRARIRRRRWPAPRAGRGGRRWAAASELAPGGLRRRDARGVAARAAPAGVGRAGQAGARALPAATQGAVRSWSPITGRGRGSISPTRRWASGRRRSARRSARSPRPAPRCGRRRSPTAAASTRGSARAPTRTPAAPAARAGAAIGCRRHTAGRGPGMAATATRLRAPQDQPPPERWGRLVNPAPAHLEAKLRFGWDFTVGQIAAMVGGILVGFAWANWLEPDPRDRRGGDRRVRRRAAGRGRVRRLADRVRPRRGGRRRRCAGAAPTGASSPARAR